MSDNDRLNRKRENVKSWAETFMAIAETVADYRVKDPSTQVGAVIVSETNRIQSIGYNGTPNGVNDDEFNWSRNPDNELESKYPYVIHAERNAVLNFEGSLRYLRGSTVYVTHYPCNECAKELIQVGISKIIYKSSYTKGISLEAAQRLFASVGIETISYEEVLKQQQ